MVQQFDPARHLTKIHGGDYLEVKWRLVWLREMHPDAQIETELVSENEGRALFKASVTIPDGGTSTGWGCVSNAKSPDYIESAETKAIGRALAALGFGTQFCTDFEYDHESSQVVDSPVQEPGQESGRDKDNLRSAQESRPATQKQLLYIRSISRELGFSQEDLDEWFANNVGTAFEELSKNEASDAIESLIELRTNGNTERSA